MSEVTLALIPFNVAVVEMTQAELDAALLEATTVAATASAAATAASAAAVAANAAALDATNATTASTAQTALCVTATTDANAAAAAANAAAASIVTASSIGAYTITATDALLALKANLASPTFTGTVTLASSATLNISASGQHAIGRVNDGGSLWVGGGSTAAGGAGIRLYGTGASPASTVILFDTAERVRINNGIVKIGTTVDGSIAAAGGVRVAGASEFSAALAVTGDFAVNTNKFTVAASSGNAVVAGTLTAGRTGIGTGASATHGLVVSFADLAGLTSYGAYISAVWSSSANTLAAGLRVEASSDNTNNSFNTIFAAISVGAVTKGATDACGTAVGVDIASPTAGSTNYAIRTTGNATSLFAANIMIGGDALSASKSLDINTAAGSNRFVQIMTAGVLRWSFGGSATAETGADAGTPFIIRALTDAGAVIDSPLSIDRAAGGLMTITRPLRVNGNIGFYNQAPVAKPTGVAVTAAAIHAALVTLNLIAA